MATNVQNFMAVITALRDGDTPDNATITKWADGILLQLGNDPDSLDNQEKAGLILAAIRGYLRDLYTAGNVRVAVKTARDTTNAAIAGDLGDLDPRGG